MLLTKQRLTLGLIWMHIHVSWKTHHLAHLKWVIIIYTINQNTHLQMCVVWPWNFLHVIKPLFCSNKTKFKSNIADSEQSSHTPGRSHQRYVETICRSKFLIFANWRDRKRREIKEQVYSGCLFLVYTIDQPFAPMCVSSFNFVCLSVPEKRDEIFWYLKIEEKEKWKIKGRISRRNLVLFFPIKQQMIHHTCTKLQNLMCNSSWEIFVTKFPMYYTGVRDGKKKKEGRINLSFVFCSTIYLATLNVYTKFEDWLS